jgi:hypothetical protein
VSEGLLGGMKSFETIPHLRSVLVRELEMAGIVTLTSREVRGIEVMVVVRFSRPVLPDELETVPGVGIVDLVVGVLSSSGWCRPTLFFRVSRSGDIVELLVFRLRSVAQGRRGSGLLAQSISE